MHGNNHGPVLNMVAKYGDHTPLSQEQLQVAYTEILACAAKEGCKAAPPPPVTPHHGHDHEHGHGHSHGHSQDASQQGVTADGWRGHANRFLLQLRATKEGGVTWVAKAAAAALLFVEGVAGMLLPALVKQMEWHRWWMGCLNAFSGGIFLSAGLMHLIPHCAEAQEEVNLAALHLPAEYPLYLLLVVFGYLLVFFVERVAFEGHAHHGHSHGHDCVPHDHSLCEEHYQIAKAHSGPLTGHHSHQPSGGEPGAAAAALGGDHHANCSHDHDHGHDHAHTAGEHTHSHNHSAGHGHEHGQGQGQLREPLLHHHELCDGESLLEEPQVFRPGKGATLLAGMTVHTALECLALGFISSHASFVALLAAIASHKAISALALSARFMREGANMRQVLTYVGPFTLVAPLSIAFGSWAGALTPAAHLVLSCFAAGTFLYVGCSEVLAEEFEGDVRSGRRDISVLAARLIKFGFVIAAVMSIAALGLMPHGH